MRKIVSLFQLLITAHALKLVNNLDAKYNSGRNHTKIQSIKAEIVRLIDEA